MKYLSTTTSAMVPQRIYWRSWIWLLPVYWKSEPIVSVFWVDFCLKLRFFIPICMPKETSGTL
ncbi:hypothetical protein XavaCFBP5823_13980 [Xanthomonas axonopodis pv. vasculorum]|nr:hypothetical protein XavaCFBP5823_13980 [Xanthomonas axonopodis pv. vasculorum]